MSRVRLIPPTDRSSHSQEMLLDSTNRTMDNRYPIIHEILYRIKRVRFTHWLWKVGFSRWMQRWYDAYGSPANIRSRADWWSILLCNFYLVMNQLSRFSSHSFKGVANDTIQGQSFIREPEEFLTFFSLCLWSVFGSGSLPEWIVLLCALASIGGPFIAWLPSIRPLGLSRCSALSMIQGGCLVGSKGGFNNAWCSFKFSLNRRSSHLAIGSEKIWNCRTSKREF